MFEFTDSERAYMIEQRAISEDEQGHEVLVGLTFEETSFYMTYGRKALSGDRDHKDTETYLELNDKHERARLEVIGTEVHLRNENPSRH